MELLYHIGLWSREYLTLYVVWLKVYAMGIFLMLTILLIVLNIISCKCLLFGWAFPDVSGNILRLIQTLFWDCCIYLVVCMPVLFCFVNNFSNIQRNNLKVSLMGDALEIESAVVISNHQSLADHIVMAYLARLTNARALKWKVLSESSYFLTLPRINFFTWFSLWQIPNFLTWFNMAKCDENWELESNFLQKFFHGVTSSKFPEWIIVFPEVNIITERDLELQNLQSKKFFLPQFNNVLYPRFSALYNVLHGLSLLKSKKFTRLYDITICYKKPPSLLDLFASTTPVEVTIFIKKRLLSKIPSKRPKLEKYLEYTWEEKDKLLSRMRSLPENTNVVDYTINNSSRVQAERSSVAGNDPSQHYSMTGNEDNKVDNANKYPV